MAIPVPTLSVKGWVTSAAQKADSLISHFYESDKRQTALYGDNVSNLQWVIEQYGHNPLLVCTQLRDELSRYLARYYQSVSVDVTPAGTDKTPGTALTLALYCDVIDDGKQYSFGRLINVNDSKFATIKKLNENGTE